MQALSEEEFDDGYGSDLMGDDEDRAKLMAMSELDREMILADRAEDRDRGRERLQNARLAKQAQQAQQKVLNLIFALSHQLLSLAYQT